jgi:Questin oxidase-like
MAFSFDNVHPERFKHAAHADASPMATLLRLADDFAAQHVAEQLSALRQRPEYGRESGLRPGLSREAGFQLQVARALDAGHGIFLELPSWLDTVPLDDMLAQMYKALSILYLVSAGEPGRRDDNGGHFGILHLLTALWGAEHVVQQLADDTARRAALKCYWAAAVAVAAVSKVGVPPRAALEATWQKYSDVYDAASVGPDGVASEHGGASVCQHLPNDEFESALGKASPDVASAWHDTMKRAMSEEEEHNIKIAYVGRELWTRYHQWTGFRLVAETFTSPPDLNLDGMF